MSKKEKRKRKRERERVDRTRLRDGERRNDLGECERNDAKREEDRRWRKRQRRRALRERRKGGREREKKKERERCFSPERTARRMSRTRGYRGTEETGLRPNMIIELGERCERSTL